MNAIHPVIFGLLILLAYINSFGARKTKKIKQDDDDWHSSNNNKDPQRTVAQTGSINGKKNAVSIKDKKFHKAKKKLKKTNHVNCYKTFYWCRANADSLKTTLQCFRKFKTCVTYNCKHGELCNESLEECTAFATKRREVHKCYKLWLDCVRSTCPMNI